ncbi:MAG: ribosomal RNA small subunit methyltransferase A [Parcubacteria group bacterium]|nr:ribosomal RNA small subunit methyltransferase A [Parcubacteria group bacterium]
MQLAVFDIKITVELTDKRIIKELLQKYNAKPEKHLGQHFILSKKALALMITAAEINSDARMGRSSEADALGRLSDRNVGSRKRRRKNDTIIEIGPGLGALTQKLAETGAHIIAIEKDPIMIEILKDTLVDCKNVKIIQSDARQLLIYEINSSYKIVANLPYNAATFLIRKWLELRNPPETMVLMIQKEVAQRICAKPPKMNLLAVSTQFYAIAEIMGYVPKESFWPKPKVDAAIIKIIPKKMTIFERSLNSDHFFKILKAGFSQPRKQLIGNLSKKLKISRGKLVLIFRNLDILSTARAENLSLTDWRKLASKLIHN